MLIRRYTRGSGDNKETYYDADVYQVHRHVDFTVDDLTIESSADRADMNTLVNTNNIINTILPFDTEKAVQLERQLPRRLHLREARPGRRSTGARARAPAALHRPVGGRAASVANYDRGVRWEAERLDVHGTRWVSMYLPGVALLLLPVEREAGDKKSAWCTTSP